ncbi:MAG: histidinol-phosphate transaminase [Acidobacteria bacterium]|nr:histidinol-phosphate transaminase [Acidobacteriota bacterium]
MPEPRSAVRRMAPYSPPSSGREGKLRLDFNENTVGCSPRVLSLLAEKLTTEQLTIYPEYEATRRALSDYFQVPEAQFLITNGTDEAIQVLINTYVDDNDEVLILHPSYAMYKFYAEVAGARVRELGYRPADLSFPVEELIAAVGPQTKAILISNPNNPTGTAIGIGDIVRILDAAPNAAVLIDEAYYEFYGVTALRLIDEYPNLFVSRTFSKAFGMAALRVGCLFSQAENVKFMHKAQSPYSVNLLAAIAVRAAVEDREYVDNYARAAVESRALLCRGFDQRGIRYYPSQANFVLFHAGAQAIPVRDALRARGVLVRDRSYELPGTVRVTAGTPAQVERFFSALDEVWQ